jgi:hypothetical protein
MTDIQSLITQAKLNISESNVKIFFIESLASKVEAIKDLSLAN